MKVTSHALHLKNVWLNLLLTTALSDSILILLCLTKHKVTPRLKSRLSARTWGLQPRCRTAFANYGDEWSGRAGAAHDQEAQAARTHAHPSQNDGTRIWTEGSEYQRGSAWGLRKHVGLPHRKKTVAATHTCFCVAVHTGGSQQIITGWNEHMKSVAVTEVC